MARTDLSEVVAEKAVTVRLGRGGPGEVGGPRGVAWGTWQSLVRARTQTGSGWEGKGGGARRGVRLQRCLARPLFPQPQTNSTSPPPTLLPPAWVDGR